MATPTFISQYPGVLWLLFSLPRIVAPAFLVYIFVSSSLGFLIGWESLEGSRWKVAVASGLTFPIVFFCSITWRRLRVAYRARVLGATSPPVIAGNLPGSLDIVWLGAKSRFTAYPGDRVDVWLRERNQTMIFRILFEDRIFTTEPAYIKMILATDFEKFGKGNRFHGLMGPLLGHGIFNTDGAPWKFHRSMSRPFFAKEKIQHFQIFDRHAGDAIGQIRDRLREGLPIDIQDVVSRFSLDCATEFLFGADVCSLSAGLRYPPGHPFSVQSQSHPSNLFAEAFRGAQEAISRRFHYSSFWPLIEFWRNEVDTRMGVISKFVDPIISAALQKKRGKASLDVEEEDTLLQHLVRQTADPKFIKDETINILIAGRDTTASTLTFAVAMLADNPHVLHRLRKEILSVLGPEQTPTFEHVRQMKYLRAVINETLRLYPPVPFNVRCATEEMVWPSATGGQPVYVPKGSSCIYSVFLMHRREDLWGPDALVFDPDRFLDDRLQKYLLPNPFVFLPFNAGPRICLGQQFAYNEMSLFLIRLLQTFSGISFAPDADPDSLPPASWAAGEARRPIERVWLKTHLTLYANNGSWFRMKEAENDVVDGQ